MGFSIGRATRKGALIAFLGTMAFAPVAVAQDSTPIPYEAPDNLEEIAGSIQADGSSTVGPLTNAVLEEFNAVAPNIEVTNGVSGTGGGFERFTAGETDISNASRPIDEEEVALADENNIEYFEFLVALDGLSVIVNPENDFVDCLTVEQLNQLWAPDSTVATWSELDPEWPEEPIELYGAGTDSGTFDFFTEEINGEAGASRTDYQSTEDDNVTVQGVAGNEFALGYLGYSYVQENPDAVRAVAIDGGEGCVEPSPETVLDGTYAPLSRPLFIYVNAESLQRPEVQEFLRFYLATTGETASLVGFIKIPADIEVEQQLKLEGAIDGSATPDSESAATPEA